MADVKREGVQDKGRERVTALGDKGGGHGGVLCARGRCPGGTVSPKKCRKIRTLHYREYLCPRGMSVWLLSHPMAEKVGKRSRRARERAKRPAGAAAASLVAREQSQRSSVLPGPVSMTTISKPRGNLPVGTNLAVVVGSNLHFVPLFFFFFFCGSGRRLCRRNHEKPERGSGLPAPAHDNSMEWRPIIRHCLFSRTLPTVTRRNLV